MEKIKWAGIAILVVLFFGSVFWLSESKKINLDGVDINKEISLKDKSGGIEEHVYHNNNSKVTLIEYRDFQCPSCGSNAPRIAKLAEDYKDKVKVIFRTIPLDIHPNALSAAAAAESAGLQGKYHEMSDLLFEKQNEWAYADANKRTDLYISYAKELGLNEAKFKEDMGSSKVKEKINFDKTVAAKATVKGTPSFYLDGKELSSEVWGDDAKLREALDQKLKN